MAKKLDLTEKSQEELVKMLGEARTTLREIRFAAAGARPKDSNAPMKARKEVARLLTELGSRAKNA